MTNICQDMHESQKYVEQKRSQTQKSRYSSFCESEALDQMDSQW